MNERTKDGQKKSLKKEEKGIFRLRLIDESQQLSFSQCLAD